MELTDKDLWAVAEARMFNAPLRWGIGRGLWNFIYLVTPVVIISFTSLLLGRESLLLSWSIVAAGIWMVFSLIYQALVLKKLIEAEYERLKCGE
jgi:hypothetical protein